MKDRFGALTPDRTFNCHVCKFKGEIGDPRAFDNNKNSPACLQCARKQGYKPSDKELEKMGVETTQTAETASNSPVRLEDVSIITDLLREILLQLQVVNLQLNKEKQSGRTEGN